MKNLKQNKTEKFYDFIDETTLYIYEQTKKSYLDSLLLTYDFLLANDETINSLELVIVEKISEFYQKIAEESFSKEEISKAFLLAMLKAFKHQKMNMSEITPDSIGILFAFLVDKFFSDYKSIDVMDACVGTGNLLITMMNNSHKKFGKIYGVDIDTTYLNIALRHANLLEYQIEYFNQNSMDNLLVPPVDLIICDLPTIDNGSTDDEDTYKLIENLMKYTKAGGYYIYLIPNDFFNQTHNENIKEIILSNTHIMAIIELPLNLFKDPKYQKSILVLKKRGENVLVNTEILMLRFPSFSEKEKVMNAIDKINQWYDNNHKN